jgi:hypothetical protein
MRIDHAFDRLQRLLSAAFLDITDRRIDQDNHHHHRGVGKMADAGSEHGSGHQHIDEQIVEVGEEAQDLVLPSRGGQAIGPVTLEPRLYLFRRKTVGAGFQRRLDLRGLLRMPGTLRIAGNGL